MSDYVDYDAIIEKIKNASNATDAQYKKISDNAISPCDINQTANSNNVVVVRNNNGDVIGYDYNYTYPNQPNTDDLEINSNNDTGLYGLHATGGGGFTRGGGAGRFPGSYYDSTGDLKGGAVDSNNNKVDVVSGFIDKSWAVVSALGKLGKQVAGQAADVIEATGLEFEAQFGGLTVKGDAEGAANAIRVLFGVDDNNNTTMYMDEDTLGALAIAARDKNFFTEGEGYDTDSHEGINLTNCTVPVKAWQVERGSVINLGGNYNVNVTSLTHSDPVMMFTVRRGAEYNRVRPVFVSLSTFSGNYNMGGAGSGMSVTSYTYNRLGVNYRFYVAYNNQSNTYFDAAAQNSGPEGRRYDLGYVVLFGHEVSSVPGVTNQTGATIPVDAITGADPHVVAQNLITQYPQLMGNPIQITVLDDSCNEVTKNYYSVPISYSPTNLNVSAPITGGLQISPSFNPDVTLDLPDIDMSKYTDQIINQLYGTGAGRDAVKPDPTNPTESFLPITPSIPNTGDGVTPAWAPDDVVGSNILWQVYNPTPAQLRALGQWLWINGDIVNQLKKIMSNPMETIFGLHKVYVTPNRGASTTIVCGNLDSEVSAFPVSDQYVEIDCGSVWVTEYFGNVLDYSPYTEISIYLPFIGIVSLSVDDVMRGEMTIKYTVDVYTGACIAEISVNRDGVGGVLYQFNGNASVEYPITAMSYNNAIMAAVGITSGVGSAIPHVLSGNMIGATFSAATSLGSAFMNQRESVQRSGSFSGNAGAMGAKIPYLIITRPQPEIANDAGDWNGYGANSTTEIGSINGYFKARHVALEIPDAYKSEVDEITSLLMSGVYS